MARSVLPRLGALAQWRAEIAGSTRRNTTADFDNLHAAACCELSALTAEAQGDVKSALWFMDSALLRLHGCYGRPDDETRDGKPGPGKRLLAELRQRAGAA
jgi:hypothetical protein